MGQSVSGKKGGLLKGKKHSECDDDGCGIKAVVDGTKTVELQGGEVIINAEAMTDPEVMTVTGTKKEIASKINSDKGYGVKFEEGGEVKPSFKTGGVLPNRIYLGEEGGSEISGKSVFEKAVQLEKQGKSNEQIRQLTGWFRNPHDKLWRFEISDKEFVLNNSEIERIKARIKSTGKPEKFTFEDIARHDILFTAYPEAKKLSVIFENDKSKPQSSFSNNTITYNFNYELEKEHTTTGSSDNGKDRVFRSAILRERRSAFAHELTHYVQIREGHGRGSSAVWEFGKLLKEQQSLGREVGESEKADLVLKSNTLYWSSSGEIEARDVQRRIEMTDEELRKNEPLKTIDRSGEPTVRIGKKMKSGGEVSDNKETYKKWRSLVNMSYSELKRFYDSEEGKKAGLKPTEAKAEGIDYGRESARWILKMKKTPVKDWTPAMWKWANKQISFISRMSGNKGCLYDENGNKTRKHTSLLIWGHNPKKYNTGGEINNSKTTHKYDTEKNDQRSKKVNTFSKRNFGKINDREKSSFKHGGIGKNNPSRNSYESINNLTSIMDRNHRNYNEVNKLLKKRESLMLRLEAAKEKSLKTWNNLGWGSGMRKTKLVSFSKEDEIKNKLNEVNSKIDQLSKGIEVEKEHKETLEKVASGEITPEQGVEETAKTHIAEDPMYYDKLEEMEQKLQHNKSKSLLELLAEFNVTSPSAEIYMIKAGKNNPNIDFNLVLKNAKEISEKEGSDSIEIQHIAESIQPFLGITKLSDDKDGSTQWEFDVHNINKSFNHKLIGEVEKQDDEYYAFYVNEMYDENYYEKTFKSFDSAEKWVLSKMNEEIDRYVSDFGSQSGKESDAGEDELGQTKKIESNGQETIIPSEDSLIMTPDKKETEPNDEPKSITNFGGDDWVKIPDSNKYIKKIISKAFTYDPYDKEFQNITEIFTGNDSLRPVFSGVNFSKDGIAVTNGHILLYMNHISNKYDGTYCVSAGCLKTVEENQIKNGKIDVKYPNYNVVVPNSMPYVYTIDLLSVKTYCETIIRSKYANAVTNAILFTFDNNSLIGFNGKLMISACEGLLKMGYHKAKIGLSEATKAGLIVADMSYNGEYSPIGKSDFALIMPVAISVMSDSETFDYKTIQGDSDFDLGGNIAYSFEEDAVITAGGNKTHKIDTNLTKEKAKETSSIRPEVLNIISNVLKKGSAIPILDYVLVKDGGAEVSNLETHLRVSGINLPDGMYVLNGDSLFPDKHDPEDYPLFPPKKESFSKIGDINRQEFLFHFKKCIDYVGKDELRPVMSGVYLSNENGKLFICATDAHALYRAEIEKFNIEGDFKAIIPDPKLVIKMLEIFDCDDIEFSMNKEKNGLVMSCGDGSISVRLIDGKYPNTEVVYPSSYNKTMKVKTADLKKILVELKAEKKKAGFKPSEPFAVIFNPAESKCQISHTSYGSYNKDRMVTVYKTIDLNLPTEYREHQVKTKDYPLLMPINIGEASEYLSGAIIGLNDFNIERIISLGYTEVEMALSEPTKAVLIMNKPILVGTKETSTQKVKKAKKDPVSDPIEPVVEATVPNIAEMNLEQLEERLAYLLEGLKSLGIADQKGKIHKDRLDQMFHTDKDGYQKGLDRLNEYEQVMEKVQKLNQEKYSQTLAKSRSEESGESKEIKDTIDGLEILKSLAKTKKEKKEIQDEIDGLNILLEMPETFGSGGVVDRYKDFDLNEDGDFFAIVNGKEYKIIYRDDKTQLYDLFENGKKIKSSKNVREVMSF